MMVRFNVPLPAFFAAISVAVAQLAKFDKALDAEAAGDRTMVLS